jgi:hypothetical protein
VLVQKTIATTPASQAIPRLIVAGMPGANPRAGQGRRRTDSDPARNDLRTEI